MITCPYFNIDPLGGVSLDTALEIEIEKGKNAGVNSDETGPAMLGTIVQVTNFVDLVELKVEMIPLEVAEMLHRTIVCIHPDMLTTVIGDVGDANSMYPGLTWVATKIRYLDVMVPGEIAHECSLVNESAICRLMHLPEGAHITIAYAGQEMVFFLKEMAQDMVTGGRGDKRRVFVAKLEVNETCLPYPGQPRGHSFIFDVKPVEQPHLLPQKYGEKYEYVDLYSYLKASYLVKLQEAASWDINVDHEKFKSNPHLSIRSWSVDHLCK